MPQAPLGIVLLAGLLAGCATPPPPPPPPPSVLLVVLDTVRADRLSAYGHDRTTDPQVALLARSGVLFEDVTAPAGWTWPSHGSLFTGLPPWVHGAHTRSEPAPGGASGKARDVTPLRTDLPTLAERLAGAGYRTTAVSQNGWLHPALGLSRGFQRVEVVDSCPKVIEQAARALDQGGDAPDFVFVNLMPGHAPWAAAPVPWLADAGPRLHPETAAEWARPFLMDPGPGLDLYRPATPGGKSGFSAYMSGELPLSPEDLDFVAALYDGGVAAADHCLKRVLEPWLAAHPDGIVVVTADHGEYLGEKGLLEHGQTAWQPVLGVPLVIAAPGRLPAGRRVAEPVQLQDVPGTILDLVGLEPLGRSLLPLVRGEPWTATPIQAAAWRHPEPAASIGGPFEHDWRLWREGDLALVLRDDGKAELYDLSQDRLMAHDLAADRPEQVALLTARARDGFPEHRSTETVEIPDEVAEALRALGYVGAAEADGSP